MVLTTTTSPGVPSGMSASAAASTNASGNCWREWKGNACSRHLPIKLHRSRSPVRLAGAITIRCAAWRAYRLHYGPPEANRYDPHHPPRALPRDGRVRPEVVTFRLSPAENEALRAVATIWRWPRAHAIRYMLSPLFAASENGGNNVNAAVGSGVVFELTPNLARTAWAETVLHQFCSQAHCADGAYPAAGLIIDTAGHLYGTTAGGGNASVDFCCGSGVAFELTPSTAGTAWTETVLYAFCTESKCTDGADPVASLVMDAQGNLFGTTNRASEHILGAVFEPEKYR
jgi:hypothetical protein